MLNKTDLNFEQSNYDAVKSYDYIKISAGKNIGTEELVSRLSELAQKYVESKGEEYHEEADKTKKTNAERKKEKRQRRKLKKQSRL